MPTSGRFFLRRRATDDLDDGHFQTSRSRLGCAPSKIVNVLSAKFQTSAPNLASCPESDLPEFAFIGRSNVGKSSLLNMLVGAKALARVSATPGHTQLINSFAIEDAWALVDLPGYGYAKRPKTEREHFQKMIAGYLCGRANLACVFVLIDSRHTPQLIDLEFVQWVIEESVPFALVFSKADLVKAGALQKNIGLFQEKMEALGLKLPRVFTASSKTKSGRQELLGFIRETLGQMGSAE